MRTLVSSVFIVSHILSTEATNFICQKNFCKDYLIKNDCRQLDDPCQNFIENNNRSGKILTDVHPCGCCDVCLEDLSEDDYCTAGVLALVPPYQVCGPGLTCMLNETTDFFQCSPDPEVLCVKKRNEFLALEKEGAVKYITQKPFCDGDGNFFPLRCNVNQTCFCVDGDGERVFGEVPYDAILSHLPNACQCSRFHDQLSKSRLGFKRSILTARCTDDGNYDPLQCFDDICYCVDPIFGNFVKGPFNMTALHSNYVGLPCFNYAIHHSNSYLHDCERPFYDLHRRMNHLEANGFDFEVKRLMKEFLKLPVCDPNGWYPAKDGKGNCMDKYNEVVLDDNVGDSSCRCPRTIELLKKHNLTDTQTCSKGNYNDKCQDPLTGLFDESCS